MTNGNEFAPKVTQTVNFLSFYIMTKDLYISMLRQGQTGADILNILETFVASDDVAETVTAAPTLQEIEF